VAGLAIGGTRQIFAALDDIRICQISGDARRIGGAIIRERHGRSFRKRRRSGIEDLPGKNGCDDQQNEGYEDRTPRAH